MIRYLRWLGLWHFKGRIPLCHLDSIRPGAGAQTGGALFAPWPVVSGWRLVAGGWRCARARPQRTTPAVLVPVRVRGMATRPSAKLPPHPSNSPPKGLFPSRSRSPLPGGAAVGDATEPLTFLRLVVCRMQPTLPAEHHVDSRKQQLQLGALELPREFRQKLLVQSHDLRDIRHGILRESRNTG